MAGRNYADQGTAVLDENRERTYSLKNKNDLNPLMERIGAARHVLLGEASHGTHEYYTWRTAITKRLIQEKGFNFIAVEGDWPDCYRINRFIKGYADQDKKAVELLKTFDRWPTWMWANWEIVGLIEWLKEYNTNLPANKRVGFYGLDVYSLWESMEALMDYLSKHDPKAAEYARNAIQCFEPYGEDEHRYARAQYSMDQSCQEAVLQLLTEIRRKAPVYDHDPEAALNVEQNAEIAVNAERYYRNMIGINVNTWNLRDTHMMETLNRILKFHGTEAKAIVWEHNTHIGDARYTDMAKSGDINVGQLVREQKGENDTVLVGFGSYSGRVIAGQNWGAPMESMYVPDARPGSVEEILHNESAEDKLLIFNRNNKNERFRKIMPHRAIGVVYNPAHEKYGNYVPTVLNSRYDAFVYIDKTKALHPLHMRPEGHKVPETYPFEY
ncbi:erythromycin esterase family protein [Rubrolithibacter danxiaensis]|uniref:erythromycin esterase family protein n=1 Tax=Rubrolithibacter danxiaensis TaxID=3390805 RepID=UPI003BF92182